MTTRSTWVKSKVAFYGYAGYSDMVLAGNDTVLLAYNGGQANGNSMTHDGAGAIQSSMAVEHRAAAIFVVFQRTIAALRPRSMAPHCATAVIGTIEAAQAASATEAPRDCCRCPCG